MVIQLYNGRVDMATSVTSLLVRYFQIWGKMWGRPRGGLRLGIARCRHRRGMHSMGCAARREGETALKRLPLEPWVLMMPERQTS
jgi:hypothetical protein